MFLRILSFSWLWGIIFGDGKGHRLGGYLCLSLPQEARDGTSLVKQPCASLLPLSWIVFSGLAVTVLIKKNKSFQRAMQAVKLS